MKQVVQSVRDGRLRVVDLPRPSIGPTEVLVAPTHSVVSAGTERAVRQLASSSLLAKARARPDLARKVIRRARNEGLRRTARSVRDRLDQDMPLGYSSAGVVVEVGEWASGLAVGDLVAAAGAGHGELQVVAAPLAVALPSGVDPAHAAFAALGTVALNGLRLADVGPGARVAVIGLGLLGRITARLAQAAGCTVVALEANATALERHEPSVDLALVDDGDPTTEAVVDWARGRGVDAVLVTAASRSPEPLARAPELARDRATIVLVGDVPITLARTPLYEKELTLRVARSYGPGRYDPLFEESGVDYPVGHVPWTARRNLEAFVDLLAGGHLDVADLITHTFPVAEAEAAYAVLEDKVAAPLGIQLVYPEAEAHPAPVPSPVRAARSAAPATVALVGAGNYARATLVPALTDAGLEVALVASASGVSAERLAERLGARPVTTDEALASDEAGLVVLATPHDTHAQLAAQALAAGKHVFCEKPLALDEDGLASVVEAWRSGTGLLAVGFNRRHAEAVSVVRDAFADRGSPLTLTYRVAAEATPPGHWYGDRRQGGRLLGEVCHFVDTCGALVGHPAVSVGASASVRGTELLLAEDLVLTIRYADDSLATIVYTTGGTPGMAKERVEVLGGGRSALIDDFATVVIDGREVRLATPGKGHAELLTAVRRAITDGAPFDVQPAIHTTATVFAAVASLTTGATADPARFTPVLAAPPA
ncbi:MAG: bi-domain-containing oxidoreductase [Acidimicrobiales bacterium]|nr:bi-domain-containing oxidoreductase [Acidimicrobiales bacterium]